LRSVEDRRRFTHGMIPQGDTVMPIQDPDVNRAEATMGVSNGQWQLACNVR
jgi:hypothetical protein